MMGNRRSGEGRVLRDGGVTSWSNSLVPQVACRLA